VNSHLVLPLHGHDASVAEVGGKAASLIRMSRAGLPVPPGVVLTTAFFAPWADEITSSETWSELSVRPLDASAPVSAQLKRRASTLPFTPAQEEAPGAAPGSYGIG